MTHLESFLNMLSVSGLRFNQCTQPDSTMIVVIEQVNKGRPSDKVGCAGLSSVFRFSSAGWLVAVGAFD